MVTTIIKGTIVSAPELGKLDITEHGYLVAENGIISGVFQVLPEQYADVPVEDFGNALILQTFISTVLSIPCWVPAWTCLCWTG